MDCEPSTLSKVVGAITLGVLAYYHEDIMENNRAAMMESVKSIKNEYRMDSADMQKYIAPIMHDTSDSLSRVLVRGDDTIRYSHQ